MTGNSRSISSNQTDVHEALLRKVASHREHPFRKPLAAFNVAAFEQAAGWLAEHDGPWILDSGCGVGASTRWLAARYPDHLVLGVDRSASRLERRHGELPSNARLLRADLVDFWRLAAEAQWRPDRHYLLYPNPYPKKQQLKQRWHAHPAFPAVMALGGELECRSNWPIYLREMAMVLASHEVTATVQPVADEPAITPFERKYRASGQTCWVLTAKL